MDRLVKIVSIDEEFEKGRGKDKKKRKSRGRELFEEYETKRAEAKNKWREEARVAHREGRKVPKSNKIGRKLWEGIFG